MASTWENIDNWLLVNLKAQMGADSAYTTIKLASYHDEILTAPQQWEPLTLPAAFVESSMVNIAEAEHGIGTPNENLSYRYGISVVALCPTKAQAKSQARTLVARLRQFLYYTYANLPALAASEGEKVEDVVIGNGFMRPIPATGGKWWAFALYDFQVLTHSRSI